MQRSASLLLSALAVVAGGLTCVPSSSGNAQPRLGRLAGRVSIRGTSGIWAQPTNVVVYLEEVPGRIPRRARRPRVIHQRNKQFAPQFMVVPVGTMVRFPNDDRIEHNVFSLSDTKRFDLGLYKSGTSHEVTFDRPGIVDVYCNIHPHMQAKILVLDTIYYDRPDGQGRFHIRHIPPGVYSAVGWQAHGASYRGEVTIEAGKTTTLDFELEAKAAPQRHTRKDGTPYGRYR